MSTTTFLLAVLGVWLVIGVATSVAMGHRGHPAFSWGLLGGVLGPLAVPLAL